MAWTVEQVLALAPDPSSAKSGKDLATPRKWVSLGILENCAWGTVQGSGKNPYQACIDLTGPAFKCTCPSRKFPCKHGLGLFLILAQQPGALTEKIRPAWATEWLAKRAEKEEKKAAQATASDTPPDPEVAAKVAAAVEKRAASREAKVAAGLAELGVWLGDLTRAGFATLPGKPATFWDAPAARLVDAQAPGLARRVRSFDGITTTGEAWPGRLLREASRLHLAREGWARLDSLPAGTQADLRAALGFTVSSEEVLAQPGTRDCWIVAGLRIEEEDRLRTQRVWLFGQTTKRAALCLSFSAGPNQPLDVTLVPGAVIDAELAFFPGSTPLRALVKQRFTAPETAAPILPHETIAGANEYAAVALASNPWLERVPFGLASVVPLRRPHGWIARDAAGHFLPLQLTEEQGWRLIALSGGHPIALAGEWDGENLAPLGAWAEGRFLRVA